MATNRFSTVILSAGASRRFSGQPKALLPVGPETAIDRVVRIAGEVGSSAIVVVVGPHAREVSNALRDRPVTIVTNAEWERGRTGSVHVGLREIAPTDDVLLWPVDHPFVESTTVHEVLSATTSDSLAWWFIPTFRDRGGHPVFLRREVRSRIEGLEPEVPLRQLIPALGIYARRIPVDDPGVVEAVDSPEEYVTALHSWRLRGGAVP